LPIPIKAVKISTAKPRNTLKLGIEILSQPGQCGKDLKRLTFRSPLPYVFKGFNKTAFVGIDMDF